MSPRSWSTMVTFWVLVGLLAVVGARAQTAPGPVHLVATCEQIGPRELAFTVHFYNCGAVFNRDFLAFIHFDRDRTRERLYTQPAPGLRPMVAATNSSEWTANETGTLQFAAVTISPSTRRDVYVKLGLWDRESAMRAPLVGQDASRRALAGRIVRTDEGYSFLRMADSPDASSASIGVRPRAMVREMPTAPVVRFGEIDLEEWRFEGLAQGAATACRTREQLCWSEASLKITYTGESAAGGFILRPPDPIPVADEADAAHLWLCGRAVSWAKPRTSEMPLLRHWVEFADAEGEAHKLGFRRAVGYPYWYVARARIPDGWPRPLAFSGVGFVGCTNLQPRSLILDALVVAKERPADELTTSVDLEDVPFPVSPDGLLPSTPTAEFRNRVARRQDTYELAYEGADESILYRYSPLTGTLDDLTVQWSDGDETEGQTVCHLAAEGGPVIRLGRRAYRPGGPGMQRRLVGTQVEGARIVTTWRCEASGGATEYTLAFEIKGKSLLVEAESAEDAVSDFSPGHCSGPADARFVPMPYWTWRLWDWGRDGGVVVAGRMFLSAYPDWYRSQASTMTFGTDVSHRPEALTAQSLCYAPTAHYGTCSDGRRSHLRERYIFTVSSSLHEVLPSIPHAPSPNRDKLAPYCHSTGGQASQLQEQLSTWRRLKAYGVNKVYIRHFDGMWADVPQGPQEWTLTEHAGPVAGDVEVARYIDELKAMGFLPVLYTNYTDLQPVAEQFDWDMIARLPDGDISDACWPGSYPLKPLRAVELQARYAPRIAQRFGTQGSFCDVHTAVAPWHKLDYDTRLPGAGQFGTTYRCYGKLLLNEREQYGAVYSEGSAHWLYAGLADGSDAELKSPHPHLEPFLLDFDLLKIHPLEMDAGMSWISRYVEDAEAVAQLGGPEGAQDRYTAATIAFGHQGTFTHRQFRGYSTDIKTYYMIQPLQMRYAMRKALAIRYRDTANGKMLDASDAVRSGAYLDSQVHVRYQGDMEVWVNGSLDQEWLVQVGESSVRLPPSGFLARGPGGLDVYSALTDSGRVDYAACEGTRVVDARGSRQVVGEFDTDGAAILKRNPQGDWQLWPLGDMTLLRVNLGALGLTGDVRVTAVDEDEQPVEDIEASVEDGWLSVPLEEHVFRYRLVPA